VSTERGQGQIVNEPLALLHLGCAQPHLIANFAVENVAKSSFFYPVERKSSLINGARKGI